MELEFFEVGDGLILKNNNREIISNIRLVLIDITETKATYGVRFFNEDNEIIFKVEPLFLKRKDSDKDFYDAALERYKKLK